MAVEKKDFSAIFPSLFAAETGKITESPGFWTSIFDALKTVSWKLITKILIWLVFIGGTVGVGAWIISSPRIRAWLMKHINDIFKNLGDILGSGWDKLKKQFKTPEYEPLKFNSPALLQVENEDLRKQMIESFKKGELKTRVVPEVRAPNGEMISPYMMDYEFPIGNRIQRGSYILPNNWPKLCSELGVSGPAYTYGLIVDTVITKPELTGKEFTQRMEDLSFMISKDPVYWGPTMRNYWNQTGKDDEEEDYDMFEIQD